MSFVGVGVCVADGLDFSVFLDAGFSGGITICLEAGGRGGDGGRGVGEDGTGSVSFNEKKFRAAINEKKMSTTQNGSYH